LEEIIILGIYKITNKINGKIYVGSSKSIESRWKQHIYELNKGTHHSNKLQRAWNKYSEEDFKFEVIQIVNNESELFKYEQEWIDKTKCYEGKYGYNICDIAGMPISKNKIKDKVKEEEKKQEYKNKISREKSKCMELISKNDDIKVNFKIKEKEYNKMVYNKQMYMYSTFLIYYYIVEEIIYSKYKDIIVGNININVRLYAYGGTSSLGYSIGDKFPVYELNFNLENNERIYSSINYGEIKKRSEQYDLSIKDTLMKLMDEDNPQLYFCRI